MRYQIPKMTVRVVLSKHDINDVNPSMMKRYACFNYPQEFTFQKKCILLFQEIHGVDVLIFGMYVQEYDHETARPNNRSVYISYLDAVKYFRPGKLRTTLYWEVLISYFSYVRERGFAYGKWLKMFVVGCFFWFSSN